MNADKMATVDFAGYIPALRYQPHAAAVIRGNERHPALSGLVRFYQTSYGVLVDVSLSGLPSPTDPCRSPMFGFHLHAGEECGAGTVSDEPFSAALGHFNPEGCDHPYHAGDMPSLLGCRGRAFQLFLTDRFELDEVIGRTVVVHAMPDDMTTQPAGASGERIGCGVIEAM